MLTCSTCRACFASKFDLSAHLRVNKSCKVAPKGRVGGGGGGGVMVRGGGVGGVEVRGGVRGGTTVFKHVEVHHQYTKPPNPKLATETKALNKQVICLIDASGSMSGDRIKQAINGTCSVLNHLDEKRDWFGFTTFHSGMTTHFQPTALKYTTNAKNASGQKYPNKRAEMQAALQRYTLEGGGTRMYDSMCDCMSHFKAPPGKLEIQTELVVLTDGGDNMSSRSAAQANEYIKKFVADTPWMRNFHITILAVGMNVTATSRCREVVSGNIRAVDGSHTPLGKVDEVSSTKIASAFTEVVRHIQQRQTATLTRITISQVTMSTHGSGGFKGKGRKASHVIIGGG